MASSNGGQRNRILELVDRAAVESTAHLAIQIEEMKSLMTALQADRAVTARRNTKQAYVQTELLDEVDILKEKLKEAEENCKSQQINYDNDLKEKKTDIEKMTGEFERLEESLNEVVDARDIILTEKEDLHTQVEKLKTERDRFRTENEEHETAIKYLKAEIEVVTEARDQLKCTEEKYEKEVKTLNEMIMVMNEERDQLKSNEEKYETDKEKYEKEVKDLKERKEELETENNRILKLQFMVQENIEDERMQCKRQVKDAHAETDELRDQNRKLISTRATQKADMKTLEKRLLEEMAEVKELRKENDVLRTKTRQGLAEGKQCEQCALHQFLYEQTERRNKVLELRIASEKEKKTTVLDDQVEDEIVALRHQAEAYKENFEEERTAREMAMGEINRLKERILHLDRFKERLEKKGAPEPKSAPLRQEKNELEETPSAGYNKAWTCRQCFFANGVQLTRCRQCGSPK